MKCLRCSIEFQQSPGLLNYCSIKCRNNRSVDNQIKIVNAVSKEVTSKLKILLSGKNHITIDILMNKNFDLLPWQSKRLRVLVEQEFKCLHCKLDTWQEVPITLELDHIDGNNINNARDNLRLLCPNCHSLTPTWRGKKNSKISLEQQRIELIKECLLGNPVIKEAPIRTTKIDWPTNQDLKTLVWSKPMRTLATELGVSGPAIVKRCKKLEIEYPKPGYWLSKDSKL